MILSTEKNYTEEKWIYIQETFFYTPRKQRLGGYIGINLTVRPSVCPSVHVPCKGNSS